MLQSPRNSYCDINLYYFKLSEIKMNKTIVAKLRKY